MIKDDDINQLKLLIEDLPLSKQYELIGDRDIARSIDTYLELTNRGDDAIDLPTIILHIYGRSILLNYNNNILKSILLFNETVKEDVINSINDINIKNENQLLKVVKSRFKTSNNEFCKSILNGLGLGTEYFIPEEEIVELVEDPMQVPEFTLHDFQKNIKDKSISLLLDPEKTNRHLIHLPTGAGKTKTTMEIICDYIRSKSVLGGFNSASTIIWIAHSKELCEQAFETFSLTWKLRGDTAVNSIKFYDEFNLTDQYNEAETTFIFMGFAKIVSALKRDNEQLRLLKKIRDNTDLFIIDEAHRSLATEWNKAINYFIDNQTTQLVGLTATPGLGTNVVDNEHLSVFFNQIKIGLSDNNQRPIENPIDYLRKRKYLAEIESEEKFTNYELKISAEEYDRIKIFGDDVIQAALDDASINPQRNNVLIDAIMKEHDENKKVLIFACSLKHCIIIQALLNSHDIHSESITSETKGSRNSILDEFKNGELNILINFGVLTTGFDAPKLNTVIIARPTFSIVLYSQMVGRALRGPKNGGNEKNKLITLRDNLNHGNIDELFEKFESVWK